VAGRTNRCISRQLKLEQDISELDESEEKEFLNNGGQVKNV